MLFLEPLECWNPNTPWLDVVLFLLRRILYCRGHVYRAKQDLEAGQASPKITLHACGNQYIQSFTHAVCRAAMWHCCSQAALVLGLGWP